MCVWSFGPDPSLEATVVGLTACVARIHSFNLSLLPSLDFRESRDKVSARTCVKVFTYVLHFWVHLVQKVSKPEELKRKRSMSVCHTSCAFTYSAPFIADTPAFSSFPFIFHFPHSSSHSLWLLLDSLKLINVEKDISFSKVLQMLFGFYLGPSYHTRFSFLRN